MFCTCLCNTCGWTPLGVSIPKAECRCFDGEASLYCSFSEILLINAWKPISGTSKDQLAQVLMPKWRGYILKPVFGNHCHYHTDVRRIFLYFIFVFVVCLLLRASGIRMALTWSYAAIERRANELTNLLRLMIGCKKKISNPFELFISFFF